MGSTAGTAQALRIHASPTSSGTRNRTIQNDKGLIPEKHAFAVINVCAPSFLFSVISDLISLLRL